MEEPFTPNAKLLQEEAMTRPTFALVLVLLLVTTAAGAAEQKAILNSGDNPDLAVSTRTTPVLVTNFPDLQSVAGTVDVGNLPAVQQVEVVNAPNAQVVEEFLTLTVEAACSMPGVYFTARDFPPGGPWRRLIFGDDYYAPYSTTIMWTSDQFPISPQPGIPCITTAILREIRSSECTGTPDRPCNIFFPVGNRMLLVWQTSEGSPRHVYLRWEK